MTRNTHSARSPDLHLFWLIEQILNVVLCVLSGSRGDHDITFPVRVALVYVSGLIRSALTCSTVEGGMFSEDPDPVHELLLAGTCLLDRLVGLVV